MKTLSRRIVTATLVALMTASGLAAYAGEGGQHSAQRAKLKAEWAEARARNAANPDATFVDRLFGTGGKDQKVAAVPATQQPKKN
jgi:hypothetical protein